MFLEWKKDGEMARTMRESGFLSRIALFIEAIVTSPILYDFFLKTLKKIMTYPIINLWDISR